jgi:hypothetical protein
LAKHFSVEMPVFAHQLDSIKRLTSCGIMSGAKLGGVPGIGITGVKKAQKRKFKYDGCF